MQTFIHPSKKLILSYELRWFLGFWLEKYDINCSIFFLNLAEGLKIGVCFVNFYEIEA